MISSILVMTTIIINSNRYLVAIFAGLAAGKKLMIQNIQRVVCFHLLKVLFVNDLQTAENVIYNLTYKLVQS